MSEVFFLSTDTLMRYTNAEWIASNPRLRTHVALDDNAVAVVAEGATGWGLETWKSRLGSCSGWDRTATAFGVQGLHGDHSGLSAERGPGVRGPLLLDLLRDRRFLVDDEKTTVEEWRPLTSILDRTNLGTFHQRVGQAMLLDRRSPDTWSAWQEQKYSADGLSLNDGPYQRIQEHFFDEYFTNANVAGTQILDFGCGNGYYTEKFASRGANVVGIDSSADLLSVARMNHGQHPSIRFVETPDVPAALQELRSLPSGEHDFIYLQDTLLLLLSPEHGERSPYLHNLFVEFARLIGPTGRLCAMEPNPIFWLAGRYGPPDRPIAVVTEYRHPVFNVAPTLDRVLEALEPAGFGLVELRHPEPAAGTGTGYEVEFPIWDFMTFKCVER